MIIRLFLLSLFLHSGFLSAGSAIAQDSKKQITVFEGIPTRDYGYFPTYLARAKGFFAQEGLDVRIVIMRSNVAVPALLNGEVQFATAGSAVNAALRGAPLRAVYFSYHTSIFQFVVRPEIRTANDLKGKTVAIASPGGSQDAGTRLMLEDLGLDPRRDVKILPMGGAQARVIAMDTGQVAGSANNFDVAAALVRKGYRILTNSAKVYPIPFSGLAANMNWARENRDTLKKWLRAHVKAVQFIWQHPAEAAQVAAKELELDADVAREVVNQSFQFMNPDDPGGASEKGLLAHIEESANRVGVDPKKFKIPDIADLTPLREAQKELGVRCRGGYLCE
ncbi:MAG: ABC transporter substrate-binding protein [Candidatus Binatia bacterium]